MVRHRTSARERRFNGNISHLQQHRNDTNYNASDLADTPTEDEDEAEESEDGRRLVRFHGRGTQSKKRRCMFIDDEAEEEEEEEAEATL